MFVVVLPQTRVPLHFGAAVQQTWFAPPQQTPAVPSQVPTEHATPGPTHVVVPGLQQPMLGVCPLHTAPGQQASMFWPHTPQVPDAQTEPAVEQAVSLA
jgi:hypothetical protein